MGQEVMKGAFEAPFRINSLPPELISYIFEAVFFDSHHPEEDHWQHRCHCFLSSHTISQVCRTWRQISISSPILWTHILYLLLPFDTHFSSTHHNPVDLCIDRSGSLSLSVEICFGWRDHTPPQEGHPEATLSRLLGTGSRWHSLVLWAFDSRLQAHLDMFVGCASSLRSLRSLEIHEWFGQDEDIPSTALAELPSLVSLRLVSPETDPMIVLPWSQIKELTTDTELILLKVLEQSSAIYWVDLSTVDTCLDGPVSSAPIQVADSLKKLIVNPKLSRYFCDAIDEFPGLSCVVQETPDWAEYTFNYAEFIKHSLCPILSKSPLLQELHLSFFSDFPFDLGSEPKPFDFSAAFASIKIFRLSFIMRVRDYDYGSKKANDLLGFLFGPSNDGTAQNHSGIDGITSHSAFPFSKISEFTVLLRIDPATASDRNHSPGSLRQLDEGDSPQRLTECLARTLSSPFPPDQSGGSLRTFRLEYDALLRDYVEAQRTLFECLHAEDHWDTVVMRKLPDLIDTA